MLLRHDGVGVVQYCTAEMRLMPGVDSYRSGTRGPKHMRIDRNAEKRSGGFGNNLSDRTLGHGFSGFGEPQRRARVLTSGENRTVGFCVFVDRVSKVVLDRTLVGSFLFGLGCCEDDPPDLVDFDEAP